jgi:hypothetical protein
MGEVSQQLYSDRAVLAFSDRTSNTTPEATVNVEEIIAALTNLSPEDKAKIAAACGGAPAGATMSGGPTSGSTPARRDDQDVTSFMSDCKKMFADLSRRMGAIEAAKGGGQQQQEATAAFSDAVQALAGRVSRFAGGRVGSSGLTPAQRERLNDDVYRRSPLGVAIRQRLLGTAC